MNTVEATTGAEPPDRPTFGDELVELLPWVAAVVVLAPITLLSLMLWAPFLLLLVPVVALVVAAGVIGLAGALLATPYLLVRHRREHAAERRRSPERLVAIPGAVAHSGGPQ
jgi:small-conductance mechanosensitive channel